MAAVTLNSRSDAVLGSKRAVFINVDIAADADYYDTGLDLIEAVQAISTTNNAIGATVGSGATRGRVTFQTAGAENGVRAQITGL